ncbi:MAG: 3-dehydro-L-gulonate 2-dehydrogenase [Negativicutes bacterium]|nr:3-dehydro-L-gulonate 2-dehydrogenase [Negativicutes bacterium]
MRIKYEDMKKEFKRVLLAKGFNEEQADLSAELFTENSCDGIYSHGVNRFPRVIEYIGKGYININAVPSLVLSKGAFERWDGNLGMGNVNAKLSMDRAVGLARQFGIGAVALGNTNHWMRGGAYGWQAARAGCVGICWTNTMPNMPVWGGKDCRIGNNPIIFAVPRAEGHVVVDMAVAQFSYGKMEECQMNHKLLPVPGGFDTKGELTQDPAEILKTWRPLPVGFWKGSGLSVLLDVIAAVLSGGNSTHEVGKLSADEYSLSQMFIAIDAVNIAGSEFLSRSVNSVIQDILGSEKVDEKAGIFYPGQMEEKTRADNLANGIPVHEEVWQKILSL